MPRDGGSRKKEGPYDKVSDEDVLDGLLAEADHAKQYDIDLETGEGREVELGDCEDFLRLNLADEDYAYVPPLVAEAMGLGVQDVELEVEEVPIEGDREGEPDQAQEPVVEEVANREEEIGAARIRKRKERVDPAREGPSKRSRRDSRSGGSTSLAEVTQALEGTGEAQPYLA